MYLLCSCKDSPMWLEGAAGLRERDGRAFVYCGRESEIKN